MALRNLWARLTGRDKDKAAEAELDQLGGGIPPAESETPAAEEHPAAAVPEQHALHPEPERPAPEEEPA
ncbi:hypothetical protein, partial [Teichococcus deserti]|uniref:hypothetical protein n=1 Tax=Teichococcus deserti TaxID=1817963 RepID=UPI001A9624DA